MCIRRIRDDDDSNNDDDRNDDKGKHDIPCMHLKGGGVRTIDTTILVPPCSHTLTYHSMDAHTHTLNTRHDGLPVLDEVVVAVMFPTDALLGDGVVIDDEGTEAALVPPTVPVVGELTANARVTWIRNRMLLIMLRITKKV